MRLGGPIYGDKLGDPESWARLVRAAGYGAAYSPCSPEDDASTIARFRAAAREQNVVIAEVGAWSNPISHNETERKAALKKCTAALDLGERLGATCVVNIAGSRNKERWDGPDPDNFSSDTFDAIVQSVREIIDSVKPKHTFYTLETMPWVFPDSTESYLELVRAIDRPAFAVHFDPVNIVCTPRRLYETGALIREFCEKLGPWIKSIHGKDVIGRQNLTFHVDECRPGQGVLDYAALLRCAEALGPEMSLMLEHLPNQAEYELAAEHVRGEAKRLGIELK